MTGVLMLTKGGGCGGGGGGEGESRCGKQTKRTSEEQNQLSIVALLLSAIRRSMVSCRVEQQEEVISSVNRMEIGWPTNVQHITHVTFDRFEGFLGLPVEFEVEVPCRVPSASASVFGVSAESMQCSFDSKGNSVPTILLLMQERLYTQGGLKAEGIFRINPENSQEEHVRDQLNRGIVPDNIDVHCLAGLIKAWFRELPEGILDGLSPEEVLQCNTEDECVELVKKLLPIPSALLNWAVDLMTDVVEEEESNKMNARNIAMVFAPNMTQMSDPLTALMHAVQVMNLLKTLILKTLREREETATVEGEGYSPFSSRSSDQQTGEDSDSQQEEMDTSCELKGSRLNYYVHNCYSTSSEDEEDEDVDPLSEIEENFLRQFNEKEEELTSDVTEESTMNLGVEQLSPSSFSRYNAESTMNLGVEQLSPSSFSGYNAESTMNLGVVEQLSPSSFSGYNAESTKDLGTEQLSPSSLSGNNAESTRDIRMEGLRPGSFSGYNAEPGFTYSDSKNESSGLSMSDAEDSVVTATGEIANSSSTHLEEGHDDERIEDTVMVEKLGGVVLT